MQFKKLTTLFLAGVVAHAQNASLPSLAETLIGEQTLSSLDNLLGSVPDIRDSLEGMTNITFLAPSNEAISATMQTPMGWTLKKDTDLLRAVMSYHVLNGTVPLADVSTDGSFIPSMLTNTSFTNVTGGQVVGAIRAPEGNVTFTSGLKAQSHVVTAGLAFNGGIIHIIDRILTIPQDLTITSQPLNLSTVENAFSLTGMIESVNNDPDLTIFAPSNAAFDALPTNVTSSMNSTEMGQLLEFNLLNGTVDYLSMNQTEVSVAVAGAGFVAGTVPIVNSTTVVSSAKIDMPNVLLSNGVMHVIDSVLLPPAPVNTTATNVQSRRRNPHARPMNMPF